MDSENPNCSDFDSFDIDYQLFWAVNIWIINSWIRFNKKAKLNVEKKMQSNFHNF